MLILVILYCLLAPPNAMETRLWEGVWLKLAAYFWYLCRIKVVLRHVQTRKARWWKHHAVRIEGKMSAVKYRYVLDENLLQSALDLRLRQQFMFQ